MGLRIKQTIESVVGDLLNKVEQLYSLAELHTQKGEQHLAQIITHTEEAAKHSKLAEKAKKIAENISALLN